MTYEDAKEHVLVNKVMHSPRAKAIEEMLISGHACPITIAAIAYCVDKHLNCNYVDPPDVFLIGEGGPFRD